ncbi:hypothetical protein C2E23DRAFT_813848 [Lenzites betulinus]|nr:hypothetical protein C2E23DRAFT_813848 [Lenzites betulinus]
MSKNQPSVIDIQDETSQSFNPDDWIGRGKTYPNDNTPMFILDARKDTLALPPEYKHLIPAPQLSVLQLLAIELPHQPANCVAPRADRQFSFDPPNEDPGILALRPVPSPHFLAGLQKAFGQAWFSGALSLVDYRFKNSRLPLWALGYWSEVSIAITKVAVWRAAVSWLNGRENLPGLEKDAVRAHTYLGQLAWTGRLRIGGGTADIQTLASLLSDSWLDDDHIDALMAHLSTRANTIPVLAQSVAVLSLAFQRAVKIAVERKAYGDDMPRFLKDCKQRINEGVQQIYFPLHVEGAHWIACVLDFKAGIIRYGDSMSATDHAYGEDLKRTVKHILEWAKRVFHRTFRDGQNTLAHGVQRDTHSCGICTVNTIAHNLFGDERFVHAQRDHWRVWYFLDLVQEQLLDNTSSKTSPLPNEHEQDITPRPEEWTTAAQLEDVSQADYSHSQPDHPTTAVSAHSMTCSSESIPETSTPSQPPLSSSTAPQIGSHKRTHEVEDDVGPPNKTQRTEKIGHSLDRSDESLCGPVGISSSAQASRKLKAAMQDGSLQVNEARRVNYEEECRLLDLGAQFRYGHSWEVFHSRCGKWLKMKEAYSRTRFRKHTTECHGIATTIKSRSKSSGAATGPPPHEHQSLDTVTSESPQQALVRQPCPPPSRPSLRFTTLNNWFLPKAEAQGEAHPKGDSSSSGSKSESDMDSDEEGLVELPEADLLPCHGITAARESQVVTYLNRTGATGGGARSITALAKERYGVAFKELSARRQAIINRDQENDRKWRNDHVAHAVFSTSCRKTVSSSAFRFPLPTSASRQDTTTLGSEGQAMCSNCAEVMRSSTFKQALRVPTPSSDHYKHLNKKYRNETMSRLYLKVVGLKDLVQEQSSELSVFARFALGIHQGKYDSRGYIVDLVKALVEVDDRKARGVGMQNFTYGPALVEFATTCAILSPEVYRILSMQFQIPSPRTLQRYRAKSPRFPIMINDQTFDVAAEYMKRLGYGSGPVALSCDDTKLHPAYRTYYDNDRQMHLLIGGTDEPRAVANADELRAALQDPTLGPKATKIRLWCLLPAIPGLPPIILAAKAIPNNLTAVELYAYLRMILAGLFRRQIRVVSYSCDGTEIERLVQKMLLSGPTDSQHTYAIPHPQHEELGLPPLLISMAVIDGYVLAIIQDSKHALKTLRNNLYSGAHTCTLGNYVAMFSHALELAHSSGSPLYIRDVEKLDRQDDNAATRLFSSAALQQLISLPGDHLIGTIVYLFVFGELVDAYQNRHISHSERIKMVLRARFFFDIWRRFLAAASYPENRYCISREAIAIIHILIDGLIALVIIHRDFMGDEKHPLFPWLHSTEVCEHVFGECRKLVKDFTYLDFLYMLPRLSTLVREACKAARSSDPRARASGYAHTYFESKGVNIAALAIFPSDDEITAVARAAWEEATNLWDLLGVTASDIFRSDTATTRLPSLSSWFAPGEDPVWDGSSSDSESGEEDDDLSDNEELTEAVELQNLLDAEETASGRSNKTDDRMFSLRCAAVATALDDITRLQSFPDPTEEERLADAEEESTYLKQTLNATRDEGLQVFLPPLNLSAEPIHPFDRSITSASDMDLTPLASIRRAHETDRAKNGTRTKGSSTKKGGEATSSSAAGDTQEPTSGKTSDSLQPHETHPEAENTSIRRAIIRDMYQVLREESDESRADGTGADRHLRWTGSSSTTTSGNTANAALAAGQRATAVVSRRTKIFKEHKIPRFEEVGNARIALPNARQPGYGLLQPGSYGIVFHQSRLYISRALAFYSRSGGKAGAHAWQASSRNIGLVSYIVVQVYEHTVARRFRAIHGDLAFLQVTRFLHLPSNQFLLWLDPQAAQLSPDSRVLELNPASFGLYQDLEQAVPRLSASVKDLNSTRRKKQETSDGEEAV